jgi:hypothetical protein
MWESSLQISFNFRGPGRNTQGRSLGRYVMNLGWSKDLLKDRATLTLSVRDLFNTRYRRNFATGENFERFSQFQWRERQITLDFTYRLNQQKQRPSRRGNEGSNEGDF